MSKLVLNVNYLLLLSFLTAAEFYNLDHIQIHKIYAAVKYAIINLKPTITYLVSWVGIFQFQLN